MNCKVCQAETNYPNGLCAYCHNCGLVGVCDEGLIFNLNTLKHLASMGRFGPVPSDHIFRLIESLEKQDSKSSDAPYPETVEVDGIDDPSGRITYFGKATRIKDNVYHCLARVDNALCKVEVSIKFK